MQQMRMQQIPYQPEIYWPTYVGAGPDWGFSRGTHLHKIPTKIYKKFVTLKGPKLSAHPPGRGGPRMKTLLLLTLAHTTVRHCGACAVLD